MFVLLALVRLSFASIVRLGPLSLLVTVRVLRSGTFTCFSIHRFEFLSVSVLRLHLFVREFESSVSNCVDSLLVVNGIV